MSSDYIITPMPYTIGKEQMVKVVFDYWSGYAGSQTEPPEEAGIEITEVWWVPLGYAHHLAINIYDLVSEQQFEWLEEAIYKYGDEQQQAAAEAKAEAQYEDWKERQSEIASWIDGYR